MCKAGLLASIILCGAGTLASAATTPAGMSTALKGMTKAVAQSEKIGAPVDVYFKHMSTTKSADPSLKMSFVPRMDGRLKVEFVPEKALDVAYGAGPLSLQKVAAAGIYNRELSIRRMSTSPAAVRAIVTFEIGNDRFFSIYNIPADSASATAMQKANKIDKSRAPIQQR